MATRRFAASQACQLAQHAMQGIGGKATAVPVAAEQEEELEGGKAGEAVPWPGEIAPQAERDERVEKERHAREVAGMGYGRRRAFETVAGRRHRSRGNGRQ